MKRCTKCVMPDTRPDVPFVGGICQACRNYDNRPQIDWDARHKALLELLDRHHGECIVPSSGGKDSHYQAIRLIELGAHVTCVTATTCQLTRIGRANIDNLARFAKTIEISPNKTVRAKLNRLGLQLVGDISWPEHVAIFTMPFNIAADLRINLLFYGENPQDQYGGPPGTEAAQQMTRRWRSEFGGFLGLRPADMIGKDGITARDMQDYVLGPPSVGEKEEAHFLGQYLPWDSHHNAKVAQYNGMQTNSPSPANWWLTENLDNAQTGIHDWFGYLKYGYGRGCAQLSVDIRARRTERAAALHVVHAIDGLFPHYYADIPFAQVLDQIHLSDEQFDAIAERFANLDILTRRSSKVFRIRGV